MLWPKASPLDLCFVPGPSFSTLAQGFSFGHVFRVCARAKPFNIFSAEQSDILVRYIVFTLRDSHRTLPSCVAAKALEEKVEEKNLKKLDTNWSFPYLVL